jgi:hypothetical protein
MSGSCSTLGRGEKYKILIGKPEWRRPRGIPMDRWQDNIRMDLMENGGKVWTGCI